MKKEYPQLYRTYYGVKSGRFNGKKQNLQNISEEFHTKLNKFLKDRPKLSDVINDKIFFDAYPEFRDVKVAYMDEYFYMERPCIYDKKKKIFYIDKSMLGEKEINMHVAAEMQRMIQDYEGFSKAYPMERVLPGNIYEEATSPIDKSDFMKYATGSYWKDPQGYYARKEAFKKKYGFYPNDVPEDYSLREDFVLSKINGGETAQSGNVEARNVMNRFYFDEKMRRNTLAKDTEDVFREMQISPKSLYDMRRFLKGPIDIIKEANIKLWDNNNRNDDWELNN
jgi:hypothetical protein